MKLYEKIVLGLVAVSFTLLFFDIDYKWVPFVITIWGLAFFYAFAGFWLFSSSEETEKFYLSILAGIAFGLAISIIPFSLKLEEEDISLLFPVPNIILCIYLAIYWIIKRKTDKITIDFKNIFKRSLVILVIGCFIVLSPIMSAPHRIVLKAVNANDKHLLNNILMFEYYDKSEKALKNGDYEQAIEYALKAEKAGRIWSYLEYDEDIDYAINCSHEDTLALYNIGERLYPIGGAYHLLTRVYKRKANKEYENGQYEKALENYKESHKYLLVHEVVQYKEMSEVNQRDWAIGKVQSLINLVRCYKKLKQYDMMDSLYSKSVQSFETIINYRNKGLEIPFHNLAYDLAEIEDYYSSTYFYIITSEILLQDTVNKKNREFLADVYNKIAENYYQLDKIQKTVHYLQQAERFLDNKKSTYYCYNLCFKGLAAHKLNEYQNADSILKNCLQCYENKPETSKQTIANVNKILAQTNITLAKYDDARKYANTSLEISEKNYGKNNIQYASCLKVLASLNKITGDYSTAYQQYKQVIEVYTQFNSNSSELVIILSDFAHLEIILSNPESAKRYSDNAMSIIISNGISLTSPSTTDFLNNTAYIQYCVGLYKQADTLYKQVVSINNNYNLPFAPTLAAALNGLGLIETERKNYKKADSLFAQSVHIFTKTLPNSHPLIANVYLNWGILQIKENKLSEAEEKINEAFKINKPIFKSDHDVFADILTAQGDIAKKRGQNDVAQNKYQQALTIYNKHFTNTHWKIVETARKMR